MKYVKRLLWAFTAVFFGCGTMERGYYEFH